MLQKLKTLNAKIYPEHLLYGPEWLVLGVNNVCNLHCKMCDVGTGYSDSNFAVNLVGSTPLHMPIELIKKIMDQAALYFPDVKIGYAFTEPLAYIHLEESLAYAKEKKLFTSITTNALNLPQKAAMLCKNGLNELAISLDGTEAIHNEIRGNKKSFQNAVRGIEALLENKNRPDISVFFVITEWNIDVMKDFVDYFKKYSLKRLGFMHTNFTPTSIAEKHNQVYGNIYPATISNVSDISVDKMDLSLLLNQINEIKNTTYPFPVVFSPDINTPQALDTFYLHPEKLMGKKCNDVSRNIMIKSNGTVIPAHGRCYNLTIGNVYEKSIKEIWNGEIISQLRSNLNKAGGLFPACSRCCSAF